MDESHRFDAAFASLFENNMGIKPGERIAVFSDTIRNDESPEPADAERRRRLHTVAEAAAAYAKKQYGNALFVSFPATAASGAEPPVELWQAVFGTEYVARLDRYGILARLIAKTASAEDLARARDCVVEARKDVADVVVALANNSASHTRFRSLANAAGCRFASLPHFDPEMFFGSMQVDWHALKERTDCLAAALHGVVEMRLSTPNGTRMTFGCAGRSAAGDDGMLSEPGSFGNLPAGEVFLAPVEGTSSGVMVLEYAPTRKLTSPVRLEISNGKVEKVCGDDPHAGLLSRIFAENPLTRNVAELGIGTNDKATRPDNILEAEKILGTVHIALGDNSGFGGSVQVPFHEDYLFYTPTLKGVTSDGTELLILDAGRLMTGVVRGPC